MLRLCTLAVVFTVAVMGMGFSARAEAKEPGIGEQVVAPHHHGGGRHHGGGGRGGRGGCWW